MLKNVENWATWQIMILMWLIFDWCVSWSVEKDLSTDFFFFSVIFKLNLSEPEMSILAIHHLTDHQDTIRTLIRVNGKPTNLHTHKHGYIKRWRNIWNVAEVISHKPMTEIQSSLIFTYSFIRLGPPVLDKYTLTYLLFLCLKCFKMLCKTWQPYVPTTCFMCFSLVAVS